MRRINIPLCPYPTPYKSEVLTGIALPLAYTMPPTATCPEKFIASAALTTDPEKVASDLVHGIPKPSSSTRAIHGLNASICSRHHNKNSQHYLVGTDFM